MHATTSKRKTFNHITRSKSPYTAKCEKAAFPSAQNFDIAHRARPHISAATAGCIHAAPRHKSPRTTCSQAVLGSRQLTRSTPAEQAACRAETTGRSLAFQARWRTDDCSPVCHPSWRGMCKRGPFQWSAPALCRA